MKQKDAKDVVTLKTIVTLKPHCILTALGDLNFDKSFEFDTVSRGEIEVPCTGKWMRVGFLPFLRELVDERVHVQVGVGPQQQQLQVRLEVGAGRLHVPQHGLRVRVVRHDRRVARLALRHLRVGTRRR